MDNNSTLRRNSIHYFANALNTLLIMVVFLNGCEREAVPQHLIGKWETSSPQYVGRYLKISENALIYGIGDDQETAHSIDKIVSKQGINGTVYIFYYKGEDEQKDSLTVTYRPDSGGELQIKNSFELWVKVDSGQTK